MQLRELLDILKMLDALAGHEECQDVYVSDLREVAHYLEDTFHVQFDLRAAQIDDFWEEEAEVELRLQIGIIHLLHDLAALLLYRRVPAVLVPVDEYVYSPLIRSPVHCVFCLFRQVSREGLGQLLLLFLLILLLVEVGIVVLEELDESLGVRLEVNFHDGGVGIYNHSAQLRLENVELLLMLVLSVFVRFCFAVAAALLLV